jgi:hypothetical protein
MEVAKYALNLEKRDIFSCLVIKIKMNVDYQPGHEPTDADENNALYYATMNQKRTICLSDPVNYQWREDPVLAYPCPEGLTCYSGRCEFTKQGCTNFSTLPYFDCKRKKVPCSFGAGQETCEMCDWDIEPSGYGGNPCPAEGSPALTDADATALGGQAIFCRPGDLKNSPSDNKPDLCRPSQAAGCPGLPNTSTPYTINGEKVSCNCDDDCNTNGVGGNCFMDPTQPGGPPVPLPKDNKCSDTLPSPAFCYPPNGMYTEWREAFTAFNSAPEENACVQTFASAKQWCEMPWTRPTVPSADGTTADPPCWQTQYKQPYYYRQEDGRCYITKSYCENNLGNGGYDSSFGDGQEYLVFSTCSTPQGNTNEVQLGYDCCTSLGSSFAEFFFGKTIPTEFDNLRNYASQIFSGNSPDTYCSNSGAQAAQAAPQKQPSSPDAPVSMTLLKDSTRETLSPLISFLSDERLKENIEMVEENACGMGIHSYHYTWNSVAKRLYKKPDGVMTGLLIKDLEKVFPEFIRTTPYGHKVFAHVPQLMPKYPDIKNIIYLCVMSVLLTSNDVATDE